MNIYVGNLSYDVRDNDLQEAFEKQGKVDSARVIMDRYTDRSRGFGFVEMTDDGEAKAAIAALDGQDLLDRPMRVNEARPREDRGGRR